MFQHTAARRRLASAFRILLFMRGGFNTQPPEGGWDWYIQRYPNCDGFNTQPPEGGWWPTMTTGTPTGVSTHSRPKAAGSPEIARQMNVQFQHTAARRRLVPKCSKLHKPSTFQHTAARRRLGPGRPRERRDTGAFQHTAARRRLGVLPCLAAAVLMVSTHSRPKAAGDFRRLFALFCIVSTHSRPKAAGYQLPLSKQPIKSFQHTAARRRLGQQNGNWLYPESFQHTAARRRLVVVTGRLGLMQLFQHTAARRRLATPSPTPSSPTYGFNTQPPEGGWAAANDAKVIINIVSTHSRPKAAG